MQEHPQLMRKEEEDTFDKEPRGTIIVSKNMLISWGVVAALMIGAILIVRAYDSIQFAIQSLKDQTASERRDMTERIGKVELAMVQLNRLDTLQNQVNNIDQHGSKAVQNLEVKIGEASGRISDLTTLMQNHIKHTDEMWTKNKMGQPP